jgi:thymidylate synthase (FAD)
LGIKVQLIDTMGSDLTVVNSARVSFSNVSETFKDKDKGLINYLAKHDHWTPFAHVQLQFRIKAPVFVARQLVKHQIGMVWNEVSRRYVDSEPEFHNPEAWRMRADDKKQGSSDEVFSGRIAERFDERYKDLMLQAAAVFDNMIATGVAPEQARMVLPQSMMTEWIWTGSLVAFARVVKLRAASDAQLECQWIANMIDKEIKQREELKHSWSALCQ